MWLAIAVMFHKLINWFICVNILKLKTISLTISRTHMAETLVFDCLVSYACKNNLTSKWPGTPAFNSVAHFAVFPYISIGKGIISRGEHEILQRCFSRICANYLRFWCCNSYKGFYHFEPLVLTSRKMHVLPGLKRERIFF